MITFAQLDSWLDKSMTDICLNGYDKSTDNHCAHFVSHALSLTFGYTCQRHTGKKNLGANLRVHEVFEQCPDTEEVLSCNSTQSGIIFVSGSSNFVTRAGKTKLNNVPKKHIGVLLAGTVWHYSNTKDKVVKQPMSEFLYHYRGQTNSLWLGAIPASARELYFGQC